MDRLPDIVERDEIRLRRATPADAAILFALFNHWNIVRWLARPEWPVSFAGVEAFLETVNKGPQGPDYWVIERHGVALGAISARIEPTGEHRSGEGPHIGYWLGEAFWGQGVMSRAVEILVEAIFVHMPVDAIYSGVFEGNEGSWRIQEKLGFEIEARGLLFSTPLGKSLPHMATRLTRARFHDFSGR